MNTTHRKENTTGVIQKWFTRGVACLALLFAAMNVSAATLTNNAVSGTWDYNNTALFGTSKWTDNNDTAQFNTGSITVNVSTVNGPVGAYGLIFPLGGLTFTNQVLLIGAGGIYQSLNNSGTGVPLLFSNNLQLTASQVWSINHKRNDVVAVGNLSGTADLILDALGYNGRFILYGSNTVSGTMTVQNAGRLLLDYSTAGKNNNKVDPNNALILNNSADIQWQGGATAFTQAVNGLTIAGSGYFYLNRVNSNNVMSVGQITRTGVGSTLRFGNTSGAVTTSSSNQNGILGAWAVTTAGWATNSTSGAIAEYQGLNQTNSLLWSTTGNINLDKGPLVTMSGDKTVNTMRLGSPTRFDLNGGTLTLNAGGLMAASANPTLSNGFIQSGLPSGELFVYANGVNLTNSATIQDNLTTPAVLVTAGANTLVLTGPTTYSGATYVNQGALLVANGATISTNAVKVSYNGTLTFNRSDAFSLTNTFTSYGIVQSTGSGTVNLSTANSTFGLPYSRYHTQPVVQNTGSGTLNLNLGGINMFGNIANSGSGALSLTGADSVNTAVQFTVSSGGIILTNASIVVGGADGTYIGNIATSVGSYLLIAGTNGPNNQTTWDNNGNRFYLGASSASTSSNYVMVSEGGVLTNFNPILGAYGATGPDNAVIVTNGGRVYGSVTLGSAAGANSNYVYVGGADRRGNSSMMVLNFQQYIGQMLKTSGNRMTVDRGGVVTNSGNITIANGANCVGNYLVVTDGGQMFNANGTVALGTSNTYNFAQITGNGSVWRNNGALAVGGGATCSSNYVSVTDGALLECTGISVGNASGSGNTVTNNGGILQFTTATPAISIKDSTQNNIVIADATISYKGLLVAGRVNLTNNWGNSGIGTNGVVWSGNNTLRLDTSAATNSLGGPYVFNTDLGPTNYVNLELLGNSAIYGKGIIIGTNGTMRLSDAVATISGGVTNFGSIAGSGMVSGLVTMASGSFLSPAGTGKLAFSTNLTFTGTSTYNWNYNASTCSVVTVGGTLTLPPTMNLTVIGSGELPANAVLLSWGVGVAPSTTWTVTPELYAVKATSTGFYLTKKTGTLILLY